MNPTIKVGRASRLPRLNMTNRKATARAGALAGQSRRLSYVEEII